MRTLIPDDLVLLFLQIIDDALNNRYHKYSNYLLFNKKLFQSIEFILVSILGN